MRDVYNFWLLANGRWCMAAAHDVTWQINVNGSPLKGIR